MKRIFLLFIILCLFCIPVHVHADEDYATKLAYTVSGSNATITGLGSHNLSDPLDIPEKVSSTGAAPFYTVTAIGDNAFKDNYGITGTLTIPNTVTYIGKYAFSSVCNMVGDLIIPDSVTSIGAHAFDTCYGLTGNLTIGNSVTSIGDNAFYRCAFTGTLTIPNTVTSIGVSAFGQCSGLTGNLVLPNTLTFLGDGAFSDCTGFTGDLTIPNSLTSIRSHVFADCTGFNGVLTIPNSVTSIGDYAFGGCRNLTGTLTIPNSVTSIGEYAFLGCSKFTGGLTLPNSLKTIGLAAFSSCNFPGNLTIPKSVTSIGMMAFYDSNVTGLVITNKSINIGNLIVEQAVNTYTYDAIFQKFKRNNDYQTNKLFIFTEGYKISGGTSVNVGDTLALSKTITPTNARYSGITWKSSDESIATVDANGVVTGKGNGVVTITSTLNNIYDENDISGTKNLTSNELQVTVSTPLAGIDLSESEITINRGDSHTMNVSFNPPDASNKNVTWTSSDPSIVSVDPAGQLQALSEGTVTITVTSEEGGYTDTCTVTVVIPVAGVDLSDSELTLNPGNSYTLNVSVNPPDATNKKLTWTSSDPSIVSVDPTGQIQALKVGIADITVTSEDGGFTDTCKVSVVISVSGVDLSDSELTLKSGDSYTLSVTINPPDATNKKVTWASSDPSIVSVDSTGQLRALRNGIAAITVTSEDGGYTDTCKVTVFTPVSGVDLSESELTLKLGDSYTMNVSFIPPEASNKNVTWASSDPSIVSVDPAGQLQALRDGNVTITVTSEDGGFNDSCTVTVIIPVSGVELSDSELTLKPGDSYTLNVTVNPPDATNKKVAWTSSDPSIVSVDPAGQLLALEEGTVTITVTSEEGGFTDTCTVISRKIEIPDNDVIPPVPAQGLIYDGTPKLLLSMPGSCKYGVVNYRIESSTPVQKALTGWSVEIPTGINPGVYEISYKVVGNTGYKDWEKGYSKFFVTIYDKFAGKLNLLLDPAIFPDDGNLHTPDIRVSVENGKLLTKGTDWEIDTATSTTSASAAGIYTVNVNGINAYNSASASMNWAIGQLEISGPDTANKDELIYLKLDSGFALPKVTWKLSKNTLGKIVYIDPDGNGVRIRCLKRGTLDITAEIDGLTSISKSVRISSNSESPQFIFSVFDIFDDDQEPIMPATGFPTTSVRADIASANLPGTGYELQIPVLDVNTVIVDLPKKDNSWDISGLGRESGLLEGSTLPGQGFSVLAGHNHLDIAESGPFLLISTLQEGDSIFVRTPEGELLRYKVYANQKLLPNDIDTLIETAELYDHSLTLLTCEDESMDGTYLNRRVVYAMPY